VGHKQIGLIQAVIFGIAMMLGAHLPLCARQAADMGTLIARATDERAPAESRKTAMLKLLRSKSPDAKDSLLDVALHRETPIAIRVQAVEAFGESGSLDDSTHLSFLLQPHNPFVLRQAVAASLDRIGCSAGCVTNVLHYLERVWNGEHALEDRFTKLPGSLERERQDQRNVETLLLDILTQNRRDTHLVLSNVYGLGSELPSATAIRAVDKLGIKDLCPDLRKAYTSSPPPDESIRKQLVDVLDGTCRGR
jgi:hypothetical protein